MGVVFTAHGIGKPEPLKYGITGAWSRRITDEHRLVSQIHGEDIIVLAARYHYVKETDAAAPV
jgi:toxin YoeB